MTDNQFRPTNSHCSSLRLNRAVRFPSHGPAGNCSPRVVVVTITIGLVVVACTRRGEDQHVFGMRKSIGREKRRLAALCRV